VRRCERRCERRFADDGRRAARRAALVDGLLAPPVREAAQRHLAGCVPCRVRHDELVALLAVGRTSRSAVTVPPDLWTVVSAATVYAPLVRRHTVRSMRPAMLLAGGALMIASVVATSWLLGAASVAEHGAVAAPAMTVGELAQARRESARLEERLRERIATLPPDEAAPLRAVADGLALHRGRLGALQEALRAQPYDPYVVERLAALAAERAPLFAAARRLAGLSG
jgi:predicted nucleic acid-binding protein